MAAEFQYSMRIGHFAQQVGAALVLPKTICVYGLLLSYGAITRLRGYEATAKKAANYSKEAERQLSLTRKTQAAGVLCLLLSLATVIILIAIPDYFDGWMKFIPSPAMLLTTVAARLYIKDYWAPYKDSKGGFDGTKVPLPYMEQYNEAEAKTEELLNVLQYLEYSWALSSLLTALGVGV